MRSLFLAAAAAVIPLVLAAPTDVKARAWIPSMPYPEGQNSATCPPKGNFFPGGLERPQKKRSLEMAVAPSNAEAPALARRASACDEIGNIIWNDIEDWAGNTQTLTLIPGVRYVFSFACSVAVRNVRMWTMQNGDFEDIRNDAFNTLTGTFTFQVAQTVAAHFELRFSELFSSGELSLFALPPA
ncbi:MAG: hypothetical protein M1825_003416 [Sarcosagium campestre]|nr:MAG: hypothetical protein M1825_003416 [Sarcosagium campestre]